MFIFHFHDIFVVTYYVNTIMIDTLIRVGRIKVLHKHTLTPLCAHSMWSLDIETEPLSIEV